MLNYKIELRCGKNVQAQSILSLSSKGYFFFEHLIFQVHACIHIHTYTHTDIHIHTYTQDFICVYIYISSHNFILINL